MSKRTPSKKSAASKSGSPTVIVDGLHVTYKAYSSGRRAQGGRKLLVRERGVKNVKALRGVSLVAREGESIGVIGPNGSGKSTFLGAIAGLTPPTRGDIYASSRPAFLGVNAVLIPDLSGDRNITLGALAMGMSHEEIHDRYEDIVQFSGLKEFLGMPMKTYSAGMSARLRFSVAISRQHSIMLVDEALAVGDQDFRERGEQRIREMCRSASTVFLVSHSMDSIRSTCNRAIWIDGGEIAMDGDADAVCSAYEASR